VLVDPLDLDEVRRRLAGRPPTMSIGEVLLDQQVVSGIGNIYRNEALFACRVNPAVPWSSLDAAVIDTLVLTAARLMRAKTEPPPADRPGAPLSGKPLVYGRAGRPCYRCRTPIATAKLGEQPRDAYWCPRCQTSP
jgi:endonuclease-8